jgi:hypothetical protein
MSEEPRILIHGGTVIDGNNAPGARADVLIEADRIVKVGQMVNQLIAIEYSVRRRGEK